MDSTLNSTYHLLGRVTSEGDNTDEFPMGALPEYSLFSSLEAIQTRALKEPELSQATQDFIGSPERSLDFQAYRAGEDSGYTRGHEAGFFKGTTVIATAGLGLAALGLFALLRK